MKGAIRSSRNAIWVGVCPVYESALMVMEVYGPILLAFQIVM